MVGREGGHVEGQREGQLFGGHREKVRLGGQGGMQGTAVEGQQFCRVGQLENVCFGGHAGTQGTAWAPQQPPFIDRNMDGCSS